MTEDASFYDPSGLSAAENAALSLYLSKIYAWVSLCIITLALGTCYTFISIESIPIPTSGLGLLTLASSGILSLVILYFIRDALSPIFLALILLSYFALMGLFGGFFLFILGFRVVILTIVCGSGTFAAMSLFELIAKRRLHAVKYFFVMSLFSLLLYVSLLLFSGLSITTLLPYSAALLLINGYTVYSTEDIITQSGLLTLPPRPKSAIHATADFFFGFIINIYFFGARITSMMIRR